MSHGHAPSQLHRRTGLRLCWGNWRRSYGGEISHRSGGIHRRNAKQGPQFRQSGTHGGLAEGMMPQSAG
jgi:hypothetical protein